LKGRAGGKEPDRVRDVHRVQQDRSRVPKRIAEVEARIRDIKPLRQIAIRDRACQGRAVGRVERGAFFDLGTVSGDRAGILDAGDGHDLHDHD